MKKHFLHSLLGTSLLALSLSAAAEDIDLFIGQPPSGTSDAPNVLLVMDNAANFSASVTTQRCSITAAGVVDTTGSGTAATNLDKTAGAVEQCALYSVIQSLDTSAGVKVNVGLMVFNSNGMKSFNALTNTFYAADCSSYKSGAATGACLAAPIVPLNATTKANLLTWIRNWATSGGSDYVIKANNNANGGSMQEAWAYLKGKRGLSGRDYSGIQPTTSNCGKNYVVFIGNAYRNNSTPGDSTGDAGPKNALLGTNTLSSGSMNAYPASTTSEQTVYGNTITTSCGTNTLESAENKGAYALNWAHYMHGQSITTYSIGVLGPTCNGEYAAHLTKMGETSVGGGKYFPTNNYTELVTAFKTILSEIQAVNSVFAAVSLPVSVNTQGTYLNQVYIGMFRPNADAYPRWMGNLKQYKLGLVNSDIKLQDADSTNAINSSTGFITDCARSFWTPNVIDTLPGYWDGDVDAKGGCSAVTDSTYSNYPDGNIVEKGGHAYKLRNISSDSTDTTRVVKTCSPTFSTCSSTSTLTSFDTANGAITQALLDSTSTVAKDTLVKFARGLNVNNSTEPVSKTSDVMRPSSHGDVVHSRPIAINYGTDVAPSVVVYYGANDGMLRAINGNRNSTTDATVGNIVSAGTTYAAGSELWAFMPPEFYGNIKRLYDNTTTISYQGSTVPGALPKPYGFDGPITAFQGTISGTSQTYIYALMRRGGRAVYAFDVTTPGAPTLKWKKGCPNLSNDTNCTSGVNNDFSGIGQTWSSAKLMYASGYGSGTSPMLIMGGGYDNCEDSDNGTVNNTCSTTKGNKIYVLNAVDGSILTSFTTTRAVVGDVTIVTDSTTGIAKFAYATDMGGNVYRISGVDANTQFASTAPGSWTMTKIASLGCSTVASCSANRKFMYAPDVVYDNGKYILMIGSGDREKPLSAYSATYGVTNYFFMIKDDPSDTAWLSSESANCSSTSIICLNSLLSVASVTTNPAQTDVDNKKGWYLALSSHEQVVTSSVTVFGTTTFSTHTPSTASPGSCSPNLGTAQVYNLAYTNGYGTKQTVSGGGLPPSPVAGKVTLDNGQTVPFCIGCSPDSALEGKYKEKPDSGSASSYKSRVYWYIEK